jgi:hypothetical protein
VGDSGPVFLGPELVQEAAKTGDFTVAMSTSMFCSPLYRFVADLQRTTGDPTTRDLVHLNEPTARRVASWMLPELAALVGRPPAREGASG